MKNFSRNLSNYFTVKNVSKTSILLNFISTIFGIIYILCASIGIVYVLILWDILGAILIVAIFNNILLVFLDSIKLNKHTKLGNRLSIFGYVYLIFIILTMYWIPQNGILTISTSYSNGIEKNLEAYSYLFISFFGIFVLGIILAFINLKNLENTDIWDVESKDNLNQSRNIRVIKSILKKLLGIICFFTLITAIYFSLIVLIGSPIGIQVPEIYSGIDFVLAFQAINGFWGLYIALYGIFYSFTFLCATVLTLKLIDKKKHKRRYQAVGIIGIIVSGIMLAPLLSTPYYVYTSEQNFAEAFGDNWRDKIPADIESEYFLETPFSIPGYLLGIPAKDVEIEKNIRYYEDKDIKLEFDFYEAKGGSKDKPGKNSILIYIHGGGLVVGDKGGDQIQVCKYFAYQGYKVFDIQYGLIEDTGVLPDIGNAPEDVKGDFDTEDIVAHLGNFSQYLVAHNDEFKADLDSVFITGGSAGGTLTCIMALAIASGSYNDIFSTNLTIKGFIPYYPGNRYGKLTDSVDNKDFLDPARMITKKSPPCLMFHGTSDGIVHPQISQDFKDTYIEENNDHCAILWGPFAGHAAEAYFSGYYSQVLVYYMERFMYLAREGDIE